MGLQSPWGRKSWTRLSGFHYQNYEHTYTLTNNFTSQNPWHTAYMWNNICYKHQVHQGLCILVFQKVPLKRASRLFPGGSDNKESACSAGDLGSISVTGGSPGGRNSITHSSIPAWRVPWTEEHILGAFLDGSNDKESACNARNPGSISGLGRSPGKGNGNPLQYSCLKNSMDRGAW